MESCMGVEVDLDRALHKFDVLRKNTEEYLEEAIEHFENLRQDIAQLAPDQEMSAEQIETALGLLQRTKENVPKIPSDHRDLHACVSRVGKAIDRHFIADFGAVAPKAEQFLTNERRPYMEQSMAQHLYRQGLEEAADTLIAEAGLEPVERSEPFAELQRTASALAQGDTGPALKWLEEHKDSLHHSPLPFTLHRMHFLKLYREQGVSVAVPYAREHLSVLAARHERELASAMCALAWILSDLTPPEKYAQILDERALGVAASEMFIREACVLLRLAPLSPLAAGVNAGARMMPPLHEIRNKMSHPHVVAAWADDLPLGVDVAEAGGGYHSIFACPILRQQASEQNPPMRLLCGHVISRDALNKLAQGIKANAQWEVLLSASTQLSTMRLVRSAPSRHIDRLKCPYCPMEQSPSEARQIYFS